MTTDQPHDYSSQMINGADFLFGSAQQDVIVAIGTDLIVFTIESGTQGPYCVGYNRSGGRCTKSIFSAYFDGWEYWQLPGAKHVEAARTDADDKDAILEQRCPLHVHERGPNAAPLEWVLFDPAKHVDFIRANPHTWMPTGSLIAPVREVVLPRRKVRTKPVAARLAAPVPEPVSGGAALYRWFDSDGRLLYVGITANYAARQTSHARKSSWSEFAATSTVERYPDWETAKAAESAAIEVEDPLFNAARADSRGASKRLVAYLVEKNRLDLLAPDVSRG